MIRVLFIMTLAAIGLVAVACGRAETTVVRVEPERVESTETRRAAPSPAPADVRPNPSPSPKRKSTLFLSNETDSIVEYNRREDDPAPLPDLPPERLRENERLEDELAEERDQLSRDIKQMRRDMDDIKDEIKLVEDDLKNIDEQLDRMERQADALRYVNTIDAGIQESDLRDRILYLGRDKERKRVRLLRLEQELEATRLELKRRQGELSRAVGDLEDVRRGVSAPPKPGYLQLDLIRASQLIADPTLFSRARVSSAVRIRAIELAVEALESGEDPSALSLIEQAERDLGLSLQ